VESVLALGYDDGSVAMYRVLYTNNYPSPVKRRTSASFANEP
jgi:hypothetical protein